MGEDKENLVGRLNATPGDLVLLKNPEEERKASGHIIKMTRKAVRLSHEDPNNPVGWTYRTFPSDKLGKGDRTYDLTGFTDYDILQSANPETPIQE